jgi:plastocyanin domain-containing protein
MEKPVIVSVGISLALIIGVLYAVSDRPAPKGQNETAPSENIAIRDGVQYVTVTARGGYSPRVTLAEKDGVTAREQAERRETRRLLPDVLAQVDRRVE